MIVRGHYLVIIPSIVWCGVTNLNRCFCLTILILSVNQLLLLEKEASNFELLAVFTQFILMQWSYNCTHMFENRAPRSLL